ncbi:hypothetical protein ACFLZE_04320 [Thermodesulfobacteriota bacterium]
MTSTSSQRLPARYRELHRPPSGNTAIDGTDFGTTGARFRSVQMGCLPMKRI